MNEETENKLLVREWYERRAQERAAWGLWSASVRQQNFDKELATKSGDERKKFLERASSENHYGFYVGG